MSRIATGSAVLCAVMMMTACGGGAERNGQAAATGSEPRTTRDTDVEAIVAHHMVGEALLAAHFVAAAEAAGMDTEAINAVLKEVASKSAIDEFWITDDKGHAYLTNTGVDFSFNPDASVEPQASVFWSLLQGTEDVVIQEARVREIDDQVFKYVGVAGIDHPRIVQVGVSARNLMKP